MAQSVFKFQRLPAIELDSCAGFRGETGYANGSGRVKGLISNGVLIWPVQAAQNDEFRQTGFGVPEAEVSGVSEEMACGIRRSGQTVQDRAAACIIKGVRQKDAPVREMPCEPVEK